MDEIEQKENGICSIFIDCPNVTVWSKILPHIDTAYPPLSFPSPTGVENTRRVRAFGKKTCNG